MNLSERPLPRAVKYLRTIEYADYKATCMAAYEQDKKGKKPPKESDMKGWYNSLIKYCETHIEAKFNITRLFKPSLNTPTGVGGRLFCPSSIQGMWKDYRGLLLGGVTTDLDMVNAHPVILRYICRQHNIPCPNLDLYVTCRDELLKAFPSRDAGKLAYLVATNTDLVTRNASYPDHFRSYDKEMKQIQKQLIVVPEYAALVDSVPDAKRDDNFYGSAINRILCYYENIILGHAMQVLVQRGLEICTLMFDGCEFYGDHYGNTELLTAITEHVEAVMCGLGMKWSYKLHETSIVIPEDFDDTINFSEIQQEELFDAMREKFELTHFKVVKRAMYAKMENHEITWFNESQLKIAYRHLQYGQAGKKKHFIPDWVNRADIRRYDNLGVYPNKADCPKSILNMWIPFYISEVEGDYEKNTDALDRFRRHVQILCNHDDTVTKYVEGWIASLFQYPENKSSMLVFLGGEGIGKGAFFTILEKMLGHQKVLETTKPSETVWGQFNSLMIHSYLVYLNELCKKESMEADAHLKNLITDAKININEKGKAGYTIQSCHHFIASSNNEDPIYTSNGDRRKLIIRCSDEMKGNVDYFMALTACLKDTAALRTIYDHYMGIEVVPKYLDVPIPETKYQNNLKEANTSYVELWVRDLTRIHHKETFLEWKATEVFRSFTEWCGENGVTYNTDAIKLAKKLSNSGIAGIDTKHTKHGNVRVFEIAALKKHFWADGGITV